MLNILELGSLELKQVLKWVLYLLIQLFLLKQFLIKEEFTLFKLEVLIKEFSVLLKQLGK